MASWEIWISETQERMLLVVPESTLAKVLSIFEREELEATAIGRLVQSGEVLLRNRDIVEGKLNLDFLFSPPLPKLEAKEPRQRKTEGKQLIQSNLASDIISLQKAPNIASKEGIVRTYDTEVQGNTIVSPFHYTL